MRSVTVNQSKEHLKDLIQDFAYDQAQLVDEGEDLDHVEYDPEVTSHFNAILDEIDELILLVREEEE